MRNISKKVQKVMFYSLSLLHLIGVYTTVHAAGQDELWLKAVKIAEANQWIPGKIVENEKVFNTKGKLEEQTESHVQLLRQNSDKIEWKLLKCIKDGKDITPKARKEIDGILNTKETDELLDLKTPFESSFQDKMSVKRLEQNKKILGRDCVAFQWTYLVDEGETEEIEGVKGVAWIEEHTGVPFEIHSAVSDSFEEDGLKISELKQIDRYTYTEKGEWYLVESVADMKIETENLLFNFKGQLRAVSTYSRHWK